MSIKVLDCTLRDGGFVNNWDFGQATLNHVFCRLVESGVEYVELGFLNESYPYDDNKSIMPSIDCMGKIYKKTDNCKSKLLAMVIMGECSIENILPKQDTIIDGIRIVFKKSGIDKALDFARGCKAKGYDIFLQPASITDYSDEDMISLVSKANELKPRAFYIVDTYGLLDKSRLFHYLDLIDARLATDISIGYHSHNNFQLSYATAMELVERNKTHDLIIDSSLLGMGKGTGNLNTELLVDYLNKKQGANYNNAQILEAIDSEIISIKQRYNWGYSLHGFIAASNDCHPTYVSYLLDKRSLSISTINQLLNRIDADKRTTFYKDLIEKIYTDYQCVDVDDTHSRASLGSDFKGRKILLLATGRTLNNESDVINKYIVDNNPIVIAVNHNPDNYNIDYCFINNAKRYAKMSLFVNLNTDCKIIATSNIVDSSQVIDYKINYANVMVSGDSEIISDNSTLMLINLLSQIGIGSVAVAGFDGFALGEATYVSNYLTFNTNKDYNKQNALIACKVAEMRKSIEINLITTSKYECNNV